MKAKDIFCASPASTAVCLNVQQRSLVRQGSNMLEHSRLLEREGISDFDGNVLLSRHRKDRSSKTTDYRRMSKAEQEHSGEIEPNSRRPSACRKLSPGNINFGSFSCSAMDSSAIVPYQHKHVHRKPASPHLSASDAPHKIVVLRVSLHCPGCAVKVRKHIAKMEGVTSINIDLMRKQVTVAGHVTPSAVLQCVSSVKNAELWPSCKLN
eukprot:TRINITY_DN4016_c0_g1_i1.p1 TRINITY_DN4016_c0_g1~~TRINITY_DN4016_c0_g1_i1.p1  ORF type:complete len:209 (-),score=4.05 TRINITY_DN4016_c0_g1_i1:296-922(-)